MKTIHLASIVGVVVTCVLAGCASQPLNVPPVGPAPGTHAVNLNNHLPHGYLRVYSDTESHEIGDNTFYYPHTSYSIYDATGLRVRWVSNHIGDMDESPTLVKLPIGRYYVVAESTSYGRVTVPIMIEEGKRTSLHLDRNWRLPAGIPTNAIIRLPNGEAVGWNLAKTP